ncbi:MAG: hypothetical protein IIX10_06385 [Clostridia bacterium]|nr:hypothetical protein [Clostridia bacterium]
MLDIKMPVWGTWLMALGFIAFIAMLVLYIRRHKGVSRSLFASPYSLWMVIFTVLPIILIAYYAFTDVNGKFTFDNFVTFWDSNHTMNKQLIEMGFDPAEMGSARGTVNMDTLVYSLWMAFLCTLICLLLGYPAAAIMADRHFKLGATLVVLFIIPMWMNFILRRVSREIF